MTDKQKNYMRVKAIEEKNKQRIKELCPEITDNSGIYVFHRHENGIAYAYVGQALHLWTRASQHLAGYQHIDLSLKKRGLWDADNPTGWSLLVTECNADELDAKEQEFILKWARTAQLYNHTTGSQGEGKRALGEAKSPKGYRDGVAQGEKNVIKKIKHLFDLHLTVGYKADKPSKNAIKALEKFNSLLKGENE